MTLRVGGLIAEAGELLEGFLLGAVEVFGDLDAHPDVEISPTASREGGDTLVAETEDLVGGGSGGDLEFEFSIEAGDADFRTQSQLRKGDRYLAEKIVFLPLKDGMGGHGENHVKISGFPAAWSGFPLPGGAEAGSGINPGGNLQFDAGVLLHPPLAMTFFAGVLDGLTGTAALGTALGDGKESPVDGDLSLAPTGWAGHHLGARGGPAALAGRAGDGSTKGDFFFAAQNRFKKIDFQIVTQVGSLVGSSAPATVT